MGRIRERLQERRNKKNQSSGSTMPRWMKWVIDKILAAIGYK